MLMTKQWNCSMGWWKGPIEFVRNKVRVGKRRTVVNVCLLICKTWAFDASRKFTI